MKEEKVEVHRCDMPLRAIEIINKFFYCRSCGYHKLIVAEKDVDNVEVEKSAFED